MYRAAELEQHAGRACEEADSVVCGDFHANRVAFLLDLDSHLVAPERRFADPGLAGEIYRCLRKHVRARCGADALAHREIGHVP